MKMKHSIIFDYDGTIHDTMNIYEPAMREAFRWLKESCSIEIPPVSSQRIASWLGMNKYEMWNSFLPDLPGELREKASDMVGAYMEEAVLTGKAVWYDGIGKTLEEMKRRGYSMAVLSNCQTSYARVHWQQFSMDRWFERFYDCESFAYLPKTEIIGRIESDFPGPYVVVGDRKSDLECAKVSGSSFVGCLYGFGLREELQGSDVLAEKPEELLEKIMQVMPEEQSKLLPEL
ncbi:MAG: HAD family hydrolase [Anaerovoracaceae bacterium]|jgi:phosphoglycolate phosphatase